MRPSRLVVLIVLLMSLAVVSSAHARFGIGVFAGEPSGFSGKWWLADNRAVDAVTGWSLGEGDFYAHTDYLWHRMIEDEELGGSVPLYYGVGARILTREDEDARFGVRIPIGLDYMLGEDRFDVFIEIAPIFDVVPETQFDLSAGIGARYYF
jgi:hypothetical protein